MDNPIATALGVEAIVVLIILISAAIIVRGEAIATSIIGLSS